MSILVHPGYDYVLKCSHIFNLIDARGAVSATDRPAYLGRIRTMARNIAKSFLNERAKLDFPLLKEETDKWVEKYHLEAEAK